MFLVATLGGSSPAERTVESFHASAKSGNCDEMMGLIQLPPDDELPRPKEKLAELLCDNAKENVKKVPDSIDTRVVKESDNSATVQAFGSVDDRDWSETYELTRTDNEWRIRWGSKDS